MSFKGISTKKASQNGVEAKKDVDGFTTLVVKTLRFNKGEMIKGEKVTTRNMPHLKFYSVFSDVDGKEQIAQTLLPFNFDEGEALPNFLVAIGYCTQAELKQFEDMNDAEYKQSMNAIRKLLSRFDSERSENPFEGFKAKIKFAYDAYTAQYWTAKPLVDEGEMDFLANDEESDFFDFDN